MEAGSYTIHRHAMMALNELPIVDRAQVLERLASITDTEIPVTRWLKAGIKKLEGEPWLYLIPSTIASR